MNHGKTLALSMAFTMLLGGCIGASSTDSTPTTTSLAPAPAATVSDDTGSINGTVVDDELKPIPGADVAISGPAAASAKTDAEGRFTFNDLAAGTYTVIAQKLGYESVGKKIDVAVGSPSPAKLVLTPIAVNTAHMDGPYVDDGYVDLNVYTFAVGYLGNALGNDKKSFKHNITTGVATMVSAMVWETATPINARYMFLSQSIGSDQTNRTIGKSPRITITADPEVKKATTMTVSWGVTFACGVDANCFIGNPDAFVPQIAYQQRVKIYTNIFYVDPAPEGFTGIPP